MFVDSVPASGTDIAVIGMAGRFPGASDIKKFWENLCGGVETISFYSNDQLIEKGINPEVVSKPNYVKASGILDDVEGFDAEFFGYSPKEAAVIDPQHRLFLESCWHALEDAGYNPDGYDGLIGLYAGASLNTYLLNNLYSNRNVMEAGGGYHMMVASDKDFLATRVCYKLNLKGPGVTIQTACSTSLVAIHMACQSLRNGECDIAMAGGVSVRVPHMNGYMYHEGIVLSKDGKCRAFDAGASGTVPGSGAGVVVLKPLEDAVADGDFIYAVVKGSTINNDGSLKAGYTAPGLEAQAAAIAEAQGVAGVDPDTITYIETHGTGTLIGDPIEIAALTKAFRQKTSKLGFCGIGSVKTNIGHIDAAAGVAGFIKTSLCLSNKKIPPTLNFNEPNPKLDLTSSPFYVNDRLAEWNCENGIRRAGVSSFGIGGTNSHAVLEEAPVRKPSLDSHPFKLLLLSSHSKDALDVLCEEMSEFLLQDEGEKLEDIAYTLQTGRKSFTHKKYVVASDKKEAAALLKKGIKKADQVEPVLMDASKRETRCFILAFEDQNHDLDKIHELYSHFPQFRDSMDACIETLRESFDILIDLDGLFKKGKESDGYFEKKYANVWRMICRVSFAKLLLELGADIYRIIGNGGSNLASAMVFKTMDMVDAIVKTLELDRKQVNFDFSEDEVDIYGLAGESAGVVRVNGVTGFKGLLDILGSLWLSGVEIDWKAIHSGERRLKVPLPKYPFQHQRLWIEPSPETKPLESQQDNELKKVQAVPAQRKRNGIDQWFYAPVWKRYTGAFEYKLENHGINVVIFENKGNDLLSRYLKQKGNTMVKVMPGEQFGFSEEQGFVINPLNKEHYERLFDEMTNRGIAPGIIIHAWCLGSNSCTDMIPRVERAVDMGVNSLVLLLKSIDRNKSDKNAELVIVTENANEVTGNERILPENALLMGAFNVAQLEYPDMLMKFVDVDDTLSGDCILSMENIYRIIFDMDSGVQCALRGRHIWQRCFEQFSTDAIDRQSTKIKDGGVYLITGGFGGIGHTFAKHLAINKKAKLVLLGRTELHSKTGRGDQTVDKEVEEMENKVAELEKYGAQVLAVSGDVSNMEAMKNIRTRIIERFGCIDGIIHAAGVPGEGLIELKKPEDTRNVLKPKVLGTLVLNHVFGDDLDFMVLCSSINSICTRIGQFDYAAANAFLDAFAQYKANLGITNVISINWDTWKETGMAAEFAGIATTEKHSFGYHPLLGECLYVSGNEIIYKTSLNLNNHWELSEHGIAGKPTLPGTAYVEMIHSMAQRHLGEGVIEISNMNFMTPVVVESGEKEILTILRKESDSWNFTVFSENEDGNTYYHAVGKVRIHDEKEQVNKVFNLNDDNFQIDKEPLRKDKFGVYDIERRKVLREGLAVDSLVISQRDTLGELRTMEFGPRWNTLRCVKHSGNEAVGFFEPEIDFTEDYEKYTIHPALLDFATSFFRLYKSLEIYLPFSYKKMTFFKPLKGPFSSWVRQVSKQQANENTMSFNISLFDTEGVHLLEIEEFSVVRVDNYKKLELSDMKIKAHEKNYGLKQRLIIEDIEAGIKNHEGVQVLESSIKASIQHIVISTRDLHMRMNRIKELVRGYSENAQASEKTEMKSKRPEMSVSYEAPRNETEKSIASIWSEVMGIENIGVNDNFFDLGGDSLLITEIHSKFIERTGSEISVANMLQFNTIAEISTFIDERELQNEEKQKHMENMDVIVDKRRGSLKKMREKALIKNEDKKL